MCVFRGRFTGRWLFLPSAVASRGVSSSPHPSAAILGARLRLRVTIRTPVFMPEAANYTSRPPPQSRHLLNAHVELQFPENSTKSAKPRPGSASCASGSCSGPGVCSLPGCRRSCAREARAGAVLWYCPAHHGQTSKQRFRLEGEVQDTIGTGNIKAKS